MCSQKAWSTSVPFTEGMQSCPYSKSWRIVLCTWALQSLSKYTSVEGGTKVQWPTRSFDCSCGLFAPCWLSKGSWKQWDMWNLIGPCTKKLPSPGVRCIVHFCWKWMDLSLFQAALYICNQGGSWCNLRMPSRTGRASGKDGQVKSCSRAHDPGGVWTLFDESY